MPRCRAALFLLLAFPPAAWAQAGDKKGEKQPDPPASLKIPPAPVVPPGKALDTFKLADGYRLELIASEPLVEDPVCLAFDADGRMWVVEMRGYMSDVEGKNEFAPNGRVVVLEDTDGDARMDRSTVFLDKLILPRSIGFAAGGVLVGEPPNLWFCRDTDGDLKCDRKTVAAKDYGRRRGNPEHMANGLLWAIDNWIYDAASGRRHRFVEGRWIEASTCKRGQWGIAQDDFGRLFYNSNSNLLRGDFVPVFEREAHAQKSPRTNQNVARRNEVWPIRVTTGVNRGYRRGTLREDFTLRGPTAACGPTIYRGDNFPEDARGNAFVCEPAGNLVKRLTLVEEKGRIFGKHTYEKSEFLASMDERFRPVNLYTGPDGCLYVLDYYRGIIEGKEFVTSYLRRQIESRGLEKPTGLGRIYRVMRAGTKPRPAPRLSKSTPSEWVALLSHPNGWHRDTAQRLIIERRDHSVVPALRRLAITGKTPQARLHALFTLEGLGRLDAATVQAALRAPDAFVRRAATALKAGGTLDPLDLVLFNAIDDANLDDAAWKKISGREVVFVRRAMASRPWEEDRADRSALMRDLAVRVAREGKPGRIGELLELAAIQTVAARWRQQAILDGMASAIPSEGRLVLAAPPAGLAKLVHAEDDRVRRAARAVVRSLAWKGKEAVPAPAGTRPLTAAERERFASGKKVFEISCAACHQLSGLGLDGIAPPLIDSEWVLGSPDRLVRIVLNGLIGPITVKGRTFEGVEMPAVQNLKSQEIADALTYLRREWGHQSDPIDRRTVLRIMDETEDRDDPWTAEELRKIR